MQSCQIAVLPHTVLHSEVVVSDSQLSGDTSDRLLSRQMCHNAADN